MFLLRHIAADINANAPNHTQPFFDVNKVLMSSNVPNSVLAWGRRVSTQTTLFIVFKVTTPCDWMILSNGRKASESLLKCFTVPVIRSHALSGHGSVKGARLRLISRVWLMLSLSDLHVPHRSLITSTKEVVFSSTLDVLFVRGITEKLLDVFSQELFKGETHRIMVSGTSTTDFFHLI